MYLVPNGKAIQHLCVRGVTPLVHETTHRLPQHHHQQYNFTSISHPSNNIAQRDVDTERLAKIGAGEFNTILDQYVVDKVRQRKSSFVSESKTVVTMHHDDTFLPSQAGDVSPADANLATAHAAYALSDCAFIYPITPSSTMGEQIDAWAAAGQKNCFGQTVLVSEMQSEGGAAGALHGSLKAGAISTTFTASQGLLLMIPNMYKIAGELLPCVIHVAARSIATHALSIFGDHQDVMGVRQTGWTMLVSENVQMAHDQALLAHLATLESRVPILHFFDGFRTSSEINDVKLVNFEDIKKIIPWDAVKRHHDLSLSPIRPHVQGLAQGPDVYFQATEASNMAYDRVDDVLEKWSEKLGKILGRKYAFFNYHGAQDAEDVIILMGSGAVTATETVDYMRRVNPHAKVGVISVRLFRPWCPEMLLDALPKTVKRIAVLDRCKEIGALGEPLFTDVSATIMHSPRYHSVKIFGGRYGLSSKEFTPGMVLSVFQNLTSSEPKTTFTVGINDDVTHLSLSFLPEPENLFPPGTKQCLFYGLGSDGTVGANKTAVKLIAKNTDQHVQAYFQYDAKKSGGLTISHLRFGPKPIYAPYNILHADYIAVHRVNYLNRYDMFNKLKEGGIVAFNFPFPLDRLEEQLPARVKRQLAQKKAKLYVVNANKIAQAAGMGKMINMIMQTVFFKLVNVLPFEEAKNILLHDIEKTYGKKNQTIIQKNINAVNMTEPEIVQVPIPTSWANVADAPLPRHSPILPPTEKPTPDREQFVNKILMPMNHLEGNDLPVSTFKPGGAVPLGTSVAEKRTIALNIPQVDMKKCTQCNYCSILCPHAAIRPFLLTPAELEKAPKIVQETAVDAIGGGIFDKYKYRIQVSPRDCTGCELCARICPADALTMTDIDVALPKEEPNWNFLSAVVNKGEDIESTTVRGSQFQQPLLEFSGACEGCGETPYVKLLTQLVGNRLIVANATGCSSIWAGSMPSIPYTTNAKGEGPAWANSLFEDNAEFGFGMRRAYKQRRDRFLMILDDALNDNSVPISPELRSLLQQYSALRHDNKHDMLLAKGRSVYHKLYEKIVPFLEKERAHNAKLQDLNDQRELFSRASHWIIGGDGWAYDIGFGGLDHILCSEEHVKVLVLDTEMYSNTGGQASKSTPSGSLTRFAEMGKDTVKKDLGQYAMTYRNVYVASISIHANHQHAVRAILEAEAYPGPALVVCYSPCISHGYPLSEAIDHCRQAVASGYWPLYRYNPELEKSGNNPFQLESKKVSADLFKFIALENRYSAVMRQDPEHAKVLDTKLQHFIEQRQAVLNALAAGRTKVAEGSEEVSTCILFGSETGNAEELAKTLYSDLKARGMPATISSMDDFDFEKLPQQNVVLLVSSTCGQGEFPSNCRQFWQKLKDPNLSMTYLSNTMFSVFGLGDSTYPQFCSSAVAFDVRLQELGATRLMIRGVGDDRHEDRYYAGWDDWEPDLWTALKVPKLPVKREIPASGVTLEKRPGSTMPAVSEMEIRAPGSTPTPLIENRLLTPAKYDRDIRHYTFDLKGTGLSYHVGDTLAVYPKAQENVVSRLYELTGFNPRDELRVATTSECRNVIPTEVSVAQLFSSILDTSGKPSRRFYDALSLYAKDNTEKRKLELLGSDVPEGKELFRQHSEHMVNYIDVLAEFPSARPPLEQLMNIIPRVKPRLYSISSSHEMYPDQIHLSIIQVDWNVDRDHHLEHRYGLCTTFLKNLKPTINVAVQVRKSGIVLPKDPSVPIIMAGMGTGLAPWRGVTQQRVVEKRRGIKVGPVWLFFGARKAAAEYLYKEEFQEYERMGVLTMRTAFSRDEEKKVYVQHRMEEAGAELYDLMFNRGGYFYVCGSARQLPVDIYGAWKRIVMKQGRNTEEEADAVLTTWKLEGRYIVEVW